MGREGKSLLPGCLGDPGAAGQLCRLPCAFTQRSRVRRTGVHPLWARHGDGVLRGWPTLQGQPFTCRFMAGLENYASFLLVTFPGWWWWTWLCPKQRPGWHEREGWRKVGLFRPGWEKAVAVFRYMDYGHAEEKLDLYKNWVALRTVHLCTHVK